MLYGSPQTAFKTTSLVCNKNPEFLYPIPMVHDLELFKTGHFLCCVMTADGKAMAFNHRTQSCPMVGFSFLITCQDPSEHREKAG